MSTKMKIILIILGIAFLAFLIVQLFALKSQKDIETYPYQVVERFDKFEIRNYEESLFTSVKVSSKGYKKSASSGFSILAGYIFGGNDKNEKIAKTSPVAMTLEDSMTVMFMVPKKLKKENLPKPNQSNIEFKEMPAKTVAAIRFNGWANDKKIAKFKQELTTALDAKQIKYTNQFYFLGYNAPYEVFGRKNEIIVELQN